MLNKPFFRGSLILLTSFGLYNFLNFLFHFSMARNLSIEDYGVLASLFSIFYITGIFSESIQTVISRYSTLNLEDSKLKNLLKKSLRKTAIASLVFLFIFLLVSVFLSYFMDIKYSLFIISGLIIISTFFLPITRGIMQGRKKFLSLGLNLILESSSKLILGMFLVFLSFRVYGAIIGSLLALMIALIFSFFTLKKIIATKEVKAETLDIYKYAKPAFLVNLSIIAFYSVDIIIAKFIFDEKIAGAYAVASVLGKIVFWGTQPINKAMFPIASENKKERRRKILYYSLFFISLISVFVLTLYYFFPGKIVILFSGKEIPEASGIIILLGISNFFISLSNLIIFYKLSGGVIRGQFFILITLFLEIFMLTYFSNNVYQFSVTFIISSIILLLNVLIFVRPK